jgi:hypothetical protein
MNILYIMKRKIWCTGTQHQFAHSLYVIETSHYLTMNIVPESHVPKDFWKAMAIPEWNKAIDTELIKFEANNCLQYVPDEEKIRASKYPYHRVVGQVMYGMVHIMVCIMYALNVLSRYGNNPGDRHIAFLKHQV